MHLYEFPREFELDQTYAIRAYTNAGIGSVSTFRRRLDDGSLPARWVKGRLEFYPREVARAIYPKDNATDAEVDAWLDGIVASSPLLTPGQEPKVVEEFAHRIKSRVVARKGAA